MNPEDISDYPRDYWWFVYDCAVNRERHNDLIGKYISPDLAADLCPLGAWMVEP